MTYAKTRVFGLIALICCTVLSSVVFWWPKVLAWPVAAIGVWVALSLFVRAWRAHRDGGNGKQE